MLISIIAVYNLNYILESPGKLIARTHSWNPALESSGFIALGTAQATGVVKALQVILTRSQDGEPLLKKTLGEYLLHDC